MLYKIEEALHDPTCVYEVASKNPSCWLKSLAGKQTWTHREVEFMKGTKRLLFATETLEECKMWVFLINLAIQKHHQHLYDLIQI
jgi:hypothetical protein